MPQRIRALFYANTSGGFLERANMPNATNQANGRKRGRISARSANRRERGTDQPANRGSGIAGTGLGDALGNGTVGEQRTEPSNPSIAQDLTRLAGLERKRAYNREWKKRKYKGLPTTGPNGVSASLDQQPSTSGEPAPGQENEAQAPTFETVNVDPSPAPARQRAPKKRTADDAGVIVSTLIAFASFIGQTIAGPEAGLNEFETNLIIPPLTRILMRADPRTNAMIDKYVDPLTVLSALVVWGSRISSLYQQQRNSARATANHVIQQQQAQASNNEPPASGNHSDQAAYGTSTIFNGGAEI